MTVVSLNGKIAEAIEPEPWPSNAQRALDLLYGEHQASTTEERIGVQKAVQQDEFVFQSDTGAVIPEEALRTLEYKFLLERNFLND